jgi:OOP family OmpA-OmpF porin
MSADVLFATDSDKLSRQSLATLHSLAEAAKGMKLEVVILVGHADAAEGLPGPHIYAGAKGAGSPVADNKTAHSRAKNRRVEMEALGTR